MEQHSARSLGASDRMRDVRFTPRLALLEAADAPGGLTQFLGVSGAVRDRTEHASQDLCVRVGNVEN